MAFGRWLFATLILSALLALSQGREKRVVPLPTSETQVFERRHGSVGVAILVGVGKYPRFSGFGELRYPERDVELLDKELTAQHYQVIPLTDGNATKESILNAIASAADVIDPGHSSIIFFFSGYAQGSDNMLATSDASVNKLAQTGLPLRAVEQALIATKAQQRMLWIDACRNEPGKGVGDGRSFAKFQAASGTRILFSTKFGRVSYEDDEFQQGVFSHYLVEGLRGAAAKEDGWVSFRDLSDYVTEQVQTRTLQQGHTQVPFEGTGQSDASGDFPVARLVGGGQVAAAPSEPVGGVSSARIKEKPKDGQRYVWIPAGSYLMGCSAGDSECYDNEKPPHSVTISKGFWMGQTAVTVGAWKRYRQATGTPELPKEDNVGRKNWNEAGADNMPAVMMTWDEAGSFCKWANMRLPTEAEWEYAARAGTTGARYGELDSIAWYADNSGNQRIDSLAVFNQVNKVGKDYLQKLLENGNFVHAVAQKQPNAWKLYDMLGNVNQWTADWYDAGYYARGEGEDPIGPPAGQYRVLRGGSWGSLPRDVRLSFRYRGAPGLRLSNIGCRCVGELP